MDLPTVWFVAVAVLWTGYFVLEGFDFGVGMLLPVLGRGSGSEADRRVVINAIGPVWDGNEVWLITAVGAMFAAFPAWYAGMLSGFYLPVLLVIVALDRPRGGVRVPGQGGRSAMEGPLGRRDRVRQRGAGVHLGALVRQPRARRRAGARRGGALRPHRPAQPVRAGRRAGDAHAVRPARRGVPRAQDRRAGAAPGPGHSTRRGARGGGGALRVPHVDPGRPRLTRDLGSSRPAPSARWWPGSRWWPAAGRAGRSSPRPSRSRRSTVVLFGALFPAVLPSLLDPAFDLTVADAASAPYTLGILSWIGAAFLPLVVLYQSWSYWVFRRRVTRAHVVMRPLDPRLVRSTAAVRVHLAVTVACGFAATALILLQAWLVARAIAGATAGAADRARRPRLPQSRWSRSPAPRWPTAPRPRRCAAPPA